jgi:iron complex outermembrane receptor protein
MRAVRFVFVLVLLPIGGFAATIRGIVKDGAGQPVAGATVAVEGLRNSTTDAAGEFAFEVSPGSYVVRISRAGFQTETRKAAADEELDIVLRPALADSIVVSGIRAEEGTPVTKTNVERDEIERTYYQQDIPLLLRDTPSVNTYTESGVGGSGYSYFTLRGVSPTRLNFTLDGVPLADSEDMGVYFSDFPDLARSLQSIQIQRGVGTSTVGSPSFGGSINLQSIDLSQTQETSARLSGGSFGQRFATVGWQSGLLPGGFAIYSRLSANETSGFRDSSGVRQHNLFVSAAKSGENSQWKFTGFSGHEYSQLAFFAADAGTLEQNLKANPLSPNDKDSFGYDLGQLQYLRSLSDHTNVTVSAFYQRGYGWYDLYDDETNKSGLRRYGLDGKLFGSMLTLSWTHGPWTANYGLHVNEFRRDHTRDLVGGPRDYSNYGTKGEANAFAKLAYDSGRWHYYGDAQLRRTDFHYHGDVSIAPITWTFFNPKVGARYDLRHGSSLYVSTGMSTREPTRNDLFQGEDNATIAHDLHAVRPERLLDVEAGWNYHTSAVTLTANVYAMEFRHEIASTGELSDIGLLLRHNVDRSYRRGIELDGSWQAATALRLRTTLNLSRNRISAWTQFFDVYDTGGNIVDSKGLTFHNVNPLLTPPLILNQSIDYTPSSRLTLGAVGRYVAKSYLDNTNNSSFVAPSFFQLDGNASWSFSRMLRLSVEINNLLNNKRVFPSGYDYIFLAPGGSIQGTSYYYPQATRNAVVMMDVKL